MSALDSLLRDVGSAAVAGGGALDVEAAVRNASDARAELAALRERVAKLEAALVKADEMAEAADTATVWRDKESLDALDLALAVFAEANPVLDNDAREATK